jgi:hypothetical protein
MRFGLLAAGLVLVAGGTVGCDDDSSGGGTRTATTAQFCGALKKFQDDFAAADPTKDLTAYVKKVKDAAAELASVGTPDSMTAAARAGFDLYVTKIKGLPDSATVDDLAGIGDVSDADQAELDALDAYVAQTCPELRGETDSTSTPSG